MARTNLKIGLVLDDSLDKTDGVQQYVLSLGSWLSTQGHEVHYLVGETKRLDIPRLHSLAKNVNVRFNGNRLSIPLPVRINRLKQLVKQEAFDVLHIQMPYSPFLAAKIVKVASPSTAIVGTFHIFPNSKLALWSNYVLAVWLRRSLRRFDKIVSVSVAAGTFAEKVFRIKSDIVPNLFDLNRFQYANKPKTKKSKTPKIIFLGRLVPRKGCRLLLEAVNYLVQNEPQLKFHLMVYGKGPLEPELKRYVIHHDLMSCVQFMGFVNEAEKAAIFASADISVFPSSGGESFGIVLLEAMASGSSAVIAGNNPGYASLMSDRRDSLFDTDDVVGLSNMISSLLVDNYKRIEIADTGAIFCRQFDAPIVGHKLENVYKQALQLRRNVR